MTISITNELVINLTASELHLLLSVLLSNSHFTIDGYHKQSGISHRTLRQIMAGLIKKGYAVKFPVQQNRVVYNFYLQPVQNSLVRDSLIKNELVSEIEKEHKPVQNAPEQPALVSELENKVIPMSNSPAQIALVNEIEKNVSYVKNSQVKKPLVTRNSNVKKPVQISPVQKSPVVDAMKALKKLGYSNGYLSGAVQLAMEKLHPNSTATDIVQFVIEQK